MWIVTYGSEDVGFLEVKDVISHGSRSFQNAGTKVSGKSGKEAKHRFALATALEKRQNSTLGHTGLRVSLQHSEESPHCLR